VDPAPTDGIAVESTGWVGAEGRSAGRHAPGAEQAPGRHQSSRHNSRNAPGSGIRGRRARAS
jgi:hypothetical protein